MNWFFAFLQIIPQMIVLSEQIFGKGNGSTKKAAALGAAAALVGKAVGDVSPAGGQVIDAIIGGMNATGGVPISLPAAPVTTVKAAPPTS